MSYFVCDLLFFSLFAFILQILINLTYVKFAIALFQGQIAACKQSGIVIIFDNHVTSYNGGHFKNWEFSYSLRFARHLFDYARVFYP